MSIPNSNTFDKQAILSEHYLFSGLSTEDVEAMLKFAKEKRYSARDFIFQKEDKGSCMMLVLQGHVRISVSSAEGKEIILNRLGAGEMFGEMALIDDEPRCADAIAEAGEEVLLLIIYRRDFLAYLDQRPKVAIELLKVLCGKIRQASDLAESIGLLPIPCRLARLLNKLAEDNGEETAEGTQVNLDISQQEMGCLIGATRESVNKNLRNWEAQGLITQSAHAIVILDEDALDDIANA